MNRFLAIAVAVMVIFSMACSDALQVSAANSERNPAVTAGETAGSKGGTAVTAVSSVDTANSERNPAVTAGETANTETGKRTVLLYICGSNLESQAAMATYNIKQILNAHFSEDEDVRFIIMTGGSGYWQTDPDLLVFPDGVNVPENAVMDYDDNFFPVQMDKTSQISNMYNQLWEARGIDALDENGEKDENAGKMVLLDGDGITGEKGEEVASEYEIMSDPEILKAFINYGVEKYPAEKYDLILWDHGGGPTDGFGVDEHDSNCTTMSFSDIADALSDNKVVDSDGDGTQDSKFDFVDFDACLMSSIELQLVLADYTDFYISSPETEPGYGQYYTNWLDKAGADPDIDTFTLGQQIVDDFIWFYEAGDGAGEDGTLTVTDTQKFIKSGIVDALADMNDVMKDEAAMKLFYDELRSVEGSIRYGDCDYFDLGNLASLLSVRNSEVTDEELAGDGEISDTNAYYDKDIASRICEVLSDIDDEDMIYGRGTEGILSRDQVYRTMDGIIEHGDLETSGVYIFFPAPDDLSEAVIYYDEMTSVIEAMPVQDDGRADFLRDYRDIVIDYALIGLTGRTVNKLINEERIDKEDIGYDEVKNYWREGMEDPFDLQYTQWGDLAEPLLERKGGGEQGALEWLESLIKQQADEALFVDNVSAKEVKTKTGTGYKIHINDVRNRCITGVSRNVTAELPVLQDYIKENFDNKVIEDLSSSAVISLGSVDGVLDYTSDIGIDSSASDVIRWMNKKESSWDIDPLEEKWYAISDADEKLHVAAIYDEKEDSYAVVGLNVTKGANATSGEEKEVTPVILLFKKDKNSSDETRKSTLSDIIFITKNSASRPVKAKDLTETVDIEPVIYVNYWRIREHFLPISENTITISADNAENITMSYTNVTAISDIKDTDGDKKALHSKFTATDIYGSSIDISDNVNSADEKLIKMDLVRLRTGIYNNGQPVLPEVIYNGKTLEEGADKDYTWEFSYIPEGEEAPDLSQCGEYSLELRGHGKFTGYAQKNYYIVLAEDAVQDMVDETQRELNDAAAAVEDAKTNSDQAALIAAYERLVAAQNAVAEAQAEYDRTRDALAREKQEELEEQISMLEDQVEDLTADLNEALVIDISNFAVTMADSIEYNHNGNKVEVSIPGLDPEDYDVSYDDNWEIGTAKVIIRPKTHKYKGQIIRTYEIVPANVSPDVTITPSSFTYDGQLKTPLVSVEDNDRVYQEGRDYIVTYPTGSKNAGTYQVKVEMTGYYAGTVSRTFKIKKAANQLKIKGKTAKIKFSKLRKKAKTLKLSKVVNVTKKGKGDLSYKLVSAKKGKKSFRKSFKINKKTGKVTVQKGLKKGTYKVRIKVTAKGNRNYKTGSKTVTAKIKVR